MSVSRVPRLVRAMTIEPTIMHAHGADLDSRHDAAIIFLDHQGARVRFLDGEDLKSVTAAHVDLGELHDRFRMRDKSLAGRYGKAHPDDTPLFAALAQVVRRCGKVLVVGPGCAKNEFVKYLARNNNDALQEHVIGIETVDHPTDGQLVAMAKEAFARAAKEGCPPVGLEVHMAQAAARAGHPISERSRKR